jgi:hypothetical protein
VCRLDNCRASSWNSPGASLHFFYIVHVSWPTAIKSPTEYPKDIVAGTGSDDGHDITGFGTLL